MSEGGRLHDIYLDSEKNIETATSLLNNYVEALCSNIDTRFSDSLPLLRAFDIFNPLSVPEREDVLFANYGTTSVKQLANHFLPDEDEEEIVSEFQRMKYHFHNRTQRFRRRQQQTKQRNPKNKVQLSSVSVE